MKEEDFPRCHWLRQQVGWNQTLADWRRFLGYDPEGCFVAEKDGLVVGTVCTISYERKFGWVAMVIVDPAQQRQGIGTFLLNAGIEHLEAKGLAVKLDATPQGKLLYDTLGFVDEYGAARYEAGRIDAPAGDLGCEELSLDDLEELEVFDKPIFGASRQPVLRSYLEIYPKLGLCRRENGRMTGYILAREGSNAFHIGPWTATNTDCGKRLLFAMLQRRQPERTFIDIVEPNLHAIPMLESLGFAFQRPFIRMFKGRNDYPGLPEFVYGMSGPELG